MSKLHCLFIGINEYHPDSGVGNLDGCVNDISNIEKFIKAKYKTLSPSIKKLTNNKATRENIIKNFQSHLIKKAKIDDTVLFYFSGHGSYSKSAKEFLPFDSKGQDESLVCYDSRCQGKYDLVDKEIAVLLSQIKEGVHIVVIIDACHSASMTRSTADNMNFGKKRFTGSRQKEKTRPISTYFLEGSENYYQDLLDQGNKVSIPNSKHILLSGCDRDQQALETFEGTGLFSSVLLKTLKSNHKLTYADLFTKVRHHVNSVAQSQLPTFESRDGFDPNTVFLLSDLKKNNNRHPIIYNEADNTWRLQYGAIHGLPSDERISKLKIGIYPSPTNASAQKTNQLVKAVEVEKVLLKETILKWKAAKSEDFFMGEIQSMPTTLLVKLDGTEPHIDAFEKIYNNTPSAFLTLDRNADKAKYTLSVEKSKLVISLTENKKEVIHGIRNTKASGVDYITKTLEQIEEWERILNLENKKSKIQKNIKLVFIDDTDENNPIDCKGNVITFDYPKAGKDKDEDGDPIQNFYSIKAKNSSAKKLHMALLHLGSNFSVTSLRKCQEIAPKSDWEILDNEHGLDIGNKNRNEVTDVFKLIVSTEPFDDYAFADEGIELGKIVKGSQGKTKAVGKRKRKSEKDWCTLTITVNTIRKENSLKQDTVAFKKEKITFIGHNKFEANIAFAPVKSATRSVHPASQLGNIFKQNGLKIVNLSAGNTRSLDDKSLIELSGIKNERSLKKNPLQLKVNHKVEKNEQIIPITFQNGFVIPFGSSEKQEDGTTTISFDSLPTSPDKRTRSLGRAVWFSLLKVTGFRNKAFLLRVASLNKKGELVRTKRSIQQTVDEAAKVLLVIHGIIGDTNVQAKELMPYVKNGTYDVMLTFDYENLNESIDDISRELNKQLTDLGFGKNDGKQLDIVAHSMGGLVSRYMIENIRGGDNMVDRLFMFGTPNGGSPFGDVPGYIDMFTKLLSIGLNFSKPFLAPIIAYLEFLEKANKVLKATKHLTVTLDQMNFASPIVKQLYKNKNIKIASKYYVIAGDVLLYSEETTDDNNSNQEKEIGYFMEKVIFKIGNKANIDRPNDIAVGVKEILHIPASFKPKKYTVKGHHMNYFLNKAAMDKFDELVKKG